MSDPTEKEIQLPKPIADAIKLLVSAMAKYWMNRVRAETSALNERKQAISEARASLYAMKVACDVVISMIRTALERLHDPSLAGNLLTLIQSQEMLVRGLVVEERKLDALDGIGE